MGEIIRSWLRTRLGVIIDLSPEIFGHYARDGTILAKLLYSYDIINDDQLRTLTRTQDPALSRVNLKNLRIWLRFIGVDCDDACTEDISNGKGTAALRLFYKVFLALENKDSLHFITLQKEREKFIPNSAKFDVTTISEDSEIRESDDHPLAAPLRTSASLIDWQRRKHDDIVVARNKERKKIRYSIDKNEFFKSNRDTKKIVSKDTKCFVDEDELRELDEFAIKHRVEESKKHGDESCDAMTKFSTEKPKIYITDDRAAEIYTKSLKRKYRREATTKEFKTKMQKALLNRVWEKVVNDREMEFDELIARKVLNQSNYEKKIMRKLCDIRNEKTRMATNRQIVEELSQITKEREARLDQERAREVLVRENEEVEAELVRMKELERRINEDAARMRVRKLRKTCVNVVNDIIDISIMAAEYKMATDNREISKSLWNQWTALFVKSQPIFGHLDEDVELANDNRDLDEGLTTENTEDAYLEREQVLNDEDFDNYHNIRSPWNDFVSIDDMDDEYLNLGILVLGYIVHKTLDSVDPRSDKPLKPPLPKMKIRATVIGVPDVLLYEPLRQLLNRSRIHLVCMEDAINHCLTRYKTEMRDHEYIDLNIVAATRQTLTRQSSASIDERNKNFSKTKRRKSVASSGKTASTTKPVERGTSGTDKVTQTPRVIPWEDSDPVLSDSAYIGKWTHEFLTLGQPLTDDLNARILLEYLKSITDVQGFVLVNYPTTYRQMASLELALNGRKCPMDINEPSNEEQAMNVEEIDPIPSRITFEDEDHDSSDVPRISRLVPDPLDRPETSNDKSYFTSFIAIKRKSMNRDTRQSQDFEILENDANSLEAYYADQENATVFHYATFDPTTLKRLARLIITGQTSVTRSSSTELFGEAVDYFQGHNDDHSSIGKVPAVKKLLSRTSLGSSFVTAISVSSQTSNSDLEIPPTSSRSQDNPPRPGNSQWPWADFSQPSQIRQSLAKLWRALETFYIDNIKDLFNLKRCNFETVVPYANFVRKHMKEFIERPDTKQDLLHEFHRVFNETDDDCREDNEVKQELYCRVDDFQGVLWNFCNDRRLEAEEERQRIVSNHWTTRETIVLANVYVGIVQAELDRFVDTMQFVQDYYSSMLQRSLQDLRQSRILLKKIPLLNETSNSNLDTSVKRLTINSPVGKKSKSIPGNLSKFPSSPSCEDVKTIEEEMTKLLTNVQSIDFDSSRTICCKFVEDNVEYVRGIVETKTRSILEVLKKEDEAASKSPILAKDKKRTSRKTSRSSMRQSEYAKKQCRDLIVEWRYAVMFEINRMGLRLRMLDAAARSDIRYLVDGMRRLFFGIHESIVDRYKNEVNSVNSMSSTFRFAIEEAMPIQKEMLLDGDRFLVRSNVLMYPNEISTDHSCVREDESSSNFQMAQLDRLSHVFRRVAPSGTMSQRSFVYILQDMIACGDEQVGMTLLPSSWLQLRACDVPRLVDDIFGHVNFVDWREFIVHAMNIDPPSVDQLLDALTLFRNNDKNLSNTVTQMEFNSIELWLFDWNHDDLDASRSSIRDNFATRAEDNVKNEETLRNHESAMNKNLQSSNDDENGEKMKSESFDRLNMTKNLLFEIFKRDDGRVNYMTMLLNFCKDEDPKLGLGKALSLACGNKICVDWHKGEDYVERVMEERRRDAEDEARRKYLWEEATLIIEAILDTVLIETFQNMNSDKISRSSIRIEKFDEPKKSMNSAHSLKSNVKSGISLVNDVDRVVTFESNEKHVFTIISSEPEDWKKSKHDRELVYWLNVEICQAVLAAMLPRLATQSDVLETAKSLRENINDVFLELRDNEINDEDDEILSHRFFDHGFVKKLIDSTNKFTTRRLGNVVDKIIRDNK